MWRREYDYGARNERQGKNCDEFETKYDYKSTDWQGKGTCKSLKIDMILKGMRGRVNVGMRV